MRIFCLRLITPLFVCFVVLSSLESAKGNTFTVTNTSSSGTGSLFQAITNANANPGADTIAFSIDSGAQTIDALQLPEITSPIIIDGTSQPGYSGAPLIELNGGGSANCLKITVGNSIVQGLVINRCGVGIGLMNGGNNVIRGNYIGTDLSGTVSRANQNGMQIESSSNNTIGGTDPSSRNIISGNTLIGVNIFRGNFNIVLGNYFGTDPSGNFAVPNRNHAISVSEASDNVIGGTAPGARNIISGNLLGITVSGSNLGAALRNRIEGNYIGLNSAGTAALGNQNSGIYLLTASDTIVGGATAEARNIVSGNNEGVKVTGGSRNRVLGNFIGTDATGMKAIPNATTGVLIINSTDITIGGTGADGNVISGNGGKGVWLDQSTTSKVQGNYIGAKADGTSVLGNGAEGIYLGNGSRSISIGGLGSGEGNVIAYNAATGLRDFGPSSPDGTSIGNPFRANRIFSNGGVGIDEAGGFNRQTVPVLNFAQEVNAGTNIKGTVGGAPNTVIGLDFFANSLCDPSGSGEGERYLGSVDFITDSAGTANIDVTLPAGNTGGSFITATATNSLNYTSNFSRCMQATISLLPPVLLTEQNSNNAIALDSVTMVRDPFPIQATVKFGSDPDTRVMLFATNVFLRYGESNSAITAQARDAQGALHPLTVEYAGKLANFSNITQLDLKLPEDLIGTNDLLITISLRGQTSNEVLLKIKP
jgi:hypothetical protein